METINRAGGPMTENTTAGKSNKFRSDIEGLRAFAVIPVLLFHAHFLNIFSVPVASGGFVGVDIFFVISGYLISGYIYNKICNENNYSITEFYSRRIKRLFPAIFVVYLFCIVVSGLAMLPEEMTEVKYSAWSSILFSSNMYFATKAGYFATALQSNPLLHTWSLSVEEQFYVVFPLALLALRPLAHRWRVAGLAVMALLSLAFSQYLVMKNADQAYYSLFARFWELLLGSLLAITNIKSRSKPAMEIIVAAGFAAIIYSITNYQSWTLFPGFNALVPCLGTAAILYGGSHCETYTSRIIALPPFTFIGKISYSLYLWHWPLLVYCRHLFTGSVVERVVALALSVVVSWLSWRFVEQPIRRLSPPSDRFRIIKAGLAAAVVTVVVSLMMVGANARIFPATPQTVALRKFSDNYRITDGFGNLSCTVLTGTTDASFKRDICLAYHPGGDNILLLGDSHAAQYSTALHSVANHANVMQATATGCLPAIGAVGERRCTKLLRYVTRDFLPTHRVEAIFLGGFWKKANVADAVSMAGWLTRYANRVYIMGPNPTFKQNLSRLMIMAQYKGDASITWHIEAEDRQADAALAAAKLPPGVEYLSYFKSMCANGCAWRASDGHPILFDDNHMTGQAAADALRRWAPKFN